MSNNGDPTLALLILALIGTAVVLIWRNTHPKKETTDGKTEDDPLSRHR